MVEYGYALVGLGNVGTAFVRHAAERAERLETQFGVRVRLVAATDSTGLVADLNGLDAYAITSWKQSGQTLAQWPGARPAGDVAALLDADCIVDCLPTNLATGEPGLAIVRAALDAGRDAVLADKGPLVAALPELERLARARGAALGTSATTGAALPTLTVARRELAGARLLSIEGILNGTSNLVLTRMREENETYAQALAEAQRTGIAEPDPTYDTAGWDTAVKMTILTRALLDSDFSLEQVQRCGIDAIPPEVSADGACVRLVGRATVGDDGRARVTVAPERIAPDDAFYHVDGARKAMRFRSDDFGDLTILGGASGRREVAAALLKDLIWCAKERKR